MANIVYMARSAWTGLLDTIRSKAGITGSMTVSQAADAVEGIETGGGAISGEFTFSQYGLNGYVLNPVIVPDGTTAISNSAFSGMKGLVTLDLPASITSMGATLFSQGSTSKLTTIICRASTPPTVNQYTFDSLTSTCSIQVPAESVEAYKRKQFWSTYASQITAIVE